MLQDEIAKLRRKVEYNRGLRKAQAETELVETLVRVDNGEALRIADSTVERLQEMQAKAAARNIRLEPYREAEARARRALAYSMRVAKRHDEALTLLRCAIEIYEELDNAPELIHTLQLLNLTYRDLEQFEAALATLDKALALGRQVGYGKREAAILGARGLLLSLLGRYREAEQDLEAGLDLARIAKDYLTEFVILGDLGLLYQRQLKSEAAEQKLNEAIELEESRHIIGDLNRMVMYWNYSRLQADRGNLRGSVSLLNRGIALADSAGLHNDKASMLLYVAGMQTIEADYAAAMATIGQVLDICSAHPFDAAVAKSYAMQAIIFAAVGDELAAGEAAEACVELLEKIDVTPATGYFEVMAAAFHLAELNLQSFDAAPYIAAFEDSLRTKRDSGNLNKLPDICISLGVLLTNYGDRQAAQQVLEEGIALSRRADYGLTQSTLQSKLGSLFASEGRHSKARSQLDEALELASRAPYPHVQIFSLELLAQICDASGLDEETRKHRQELETLRQRYCSPDVILALRRQRDKDRILGLETELAAAQSELKELRDKISVLQRQMQSRSAQNKQLTERLAHLTEAMRFGEQEEHTAFQQRIEKMRAEIQTGMEQADWSTFEREAGEQEQEFMRRLIAAYPALTNTERKICALIRLNNTTRDLCRLLNISQRSVQVYRYRIRKKLQLPSEADLNAFILEF